jgi:hypothetical protein
MNRTTNNEGEIMSEMIEQTIEQTNERTSVSLRAEATEAAAQVAELEREQQEVTTKLRDPATVFDARLVVELRQRFDELPLFLNAARLKHASLRVGAFDLEALEHKSRMEPLHQAMMEEKPRLDAAQVAYDAKVNAWQGARLDARVSQLDANEARSIVRQLEAEAHAMGGAVVRRRPQAA